VSEFRTADGAVPVNDALRNDFCDEDDDFYIDDAAYGPDMAINAHLPHLQRVLSGFSVVSVPICDSDPAIVREFAYVMSEIMGGRNALLVIASELLVSEQAHWERIGEHIESKSISNVFNLVNSGAFRMHGSEAFVGGLLVAEAWGLDIDFRPGSKPGESLNCGLAYAGA
jgi:AmmeMemoRadiSam system protein B